MMQTHTAQIVKQESLVRTSYHLKFFSQYRLFKLPTVVSFEGSK